MSDVYKENPNRRGVTYVPPDSFAIKAFAFQVCAERDLGNAHYTHQEVVTGLTSFLKFIARTSARYMNSGHQRFLLKGYKQPKQSQKGE